MSLLSIDDQYVLERLLLLRSGASTKGFGPQPGLAPHRPRLVDHLCTFVLFSPDLLLELRFVTLQTASNFRQRQQLTPFRLKLACQPRVFHFFLMPAILSSITSYLRLPCTFSFLRPPHLSLTCSNPNPKKTRFPTSALIFSLFSPRV